MLSMKIDEYISYLPATNNPLSSDVGMIDGKSFLWLYDVGNSLDAALFLNHIDKPKSIVLSHFHPDHIGNLPNLSGLIGDHALYLSRHTSGYTNRSGIEIKDHVYFQDGFDIHLFPLPSSHAKGCIGMEINETYAFLGDGIYATAKNQRVAYNASLLFEEICLLRKLRAPYFLISHDPKFIREKTEIIEQLEMIYQNRDSHSPYIYI